MRCIFCLKDRSPSLEHVFPDAIGGTLTIARVCEPCNSWLGTNVDSYLTDHIGVLMKRFLLRIPNRDGKTIGLDDILGSAFSPTIPSNGSSLSASEARTR